MEELVLTPEDQTVYDAYMAPDSTVLDLSALSPEGSEAVRAFHSAKIVTAADYPIAPEPLFVERIAGAVSDFGTTTADLASKAGSYIAGAPGNIADWVTGENVQFPELQRGYWIDDAKSQTPAGFVSQTGASPAQAAEYQLLTLSTLDDYKMEEGIKKIFPEAKTSYDDFGNLLAEVNGTRFYPNPRGLDAPTTAQLGGAATLAMGLEGLGARLIGQQAMRGYKGTAAITGTEAAIMEGVSSQITGLPYDWTAPAAGAVFGPTFLGLGKLFGAASSRIMARFKKDPTSVLNPDGTFTADTVSYLKSKGLEPDEVQAELFVAFKNLSESGYIPQEALVMAQSQGLPVPIQLTTGQLRNDANQMLREDALLKGTSTADDALQYSIFMDAQIAAIRENVDIIAERVSGTSGTRTQRGEGAAEAQALLSRNKENALLAADQKYITARKERDLYLEPDSAGTFADELTLGFEIKGFVEGTAPKVVKLVEELKLKIASPQGMTVKQIFNDRAALTALTKSGEGVEAAAAREAVDQLDNYLDNVVEANLSQRMDQFAEDQTTTQSILAWKDAINTWKGFKQRWETKGILNSLTAKEIRDGSLQLKVAPEDAVNFIFNSNATGLVNKKNIVRDLRVMKQELPPEQWDLVRTEALNSLLDGSLTITAEQSASRASTRLSTSWASLRNTNKPLVDLLFDRKEQGMISSLANLTGRIANRTQNTSNSGAMLGQMLGRLYKSLNGSVTARTIAGQVAAMISSGTESGRRTFAVPARPSGGNLNASPNPIIIGGSSSAALEPENREVIGEVLEEVPVLGPVIAEPFINPQASVSREMLRKTLAPSTRGGISGLGEPANEVAAAPAMAPPPSAVAQGQGPSESRQMMDQLFTSPFDIA
jgi:hypothetical protein